MTPILPSVRPRHEACGTALFLDQCRSLMLSLSTGSVNCARMLIARASSSEYTTRRRAAT
eukprot:4684093-Pyramimonas_sp.AAC.1